MTTTGNAQLRLSLDGDWFFKADPEQQGITMHWQADSTDKSGWEVHVTPRFWEGYPGMAGYDGWGWYARTFQLPRVGEHLSIHFAGVDDDAQVWVNGIDVGSHTGYSDPFVVDITPAVQEGVNTIVVLVKDYAGGGGIYKPVTLVDTRHLDDLLRSEFADKPARKSAEWVRDAVIYEVYLRSFSKEGTFDGLKRRLPELRNLGVTVLWLMPVHPVGVKNRKGTLGSPYAVQDYYAINPAFGTMADFKLLLAAVHRLGMKLIIDLVANHTSWDSKLMEEHPAWFTHDAQGAIVPPNADWTDVADLDYSHRELRDYMIAMMRWWVKDVGIDGFRCDVAEMVPTDFWEEARAQLNRIKPVMMLSEGSLPEQHLKAFDLTYSWNMYDILPVLLEGKRPVSLIDDILKTESLQFPVGSLRMRFNTNHDKNAWDQPAVLKYGQDGLRLTAVFVNTIPGVPLMYTGEEVANDRKLALFEKVDVDWTRPRDMGDLYTALAKLRREHKALTRGGMTPLHTAHSRDVYAFLRNAGKDKIIVVLNFASAPRFTNVEIPMGKLFPGAASVGLKDWFSGDLQEVKAAGTEQIVLALEPRDYRVFVVDER